MISEILGVVFIEAYILLAAIDIVTLFIPGAGSFGTYIFIGTACIFLFLCIFLFFILIKEQLNGRRFAICTVILIWAGIILYNAAVPYNLSGETTLEIGCYLRHFHESIGKGYHDTCLFGYPAKQYMLPSLPSLIFDTSMTALNIGGSLYFLMGIMLFSFGVWRYNGKNSADILGGIFLSIIFHVHYVGHFLLFFEQSIFPISFGLMLGGLFLLYLADKKLLWLSLLGFVLQLLIFSYTPGLGLYFLCIVSVIILLYRDIPRNHKLLFGFYLISSLSSFFISLGFRNDLHFTGTNTTLTSLMTDFQAGFYQVFISPKGTPMVSAWYYWLFLAMLAIPFFIKRNLWPRLVLVWILGILTLAVLSKGYTYYAIGFRLHRALIIFPVLFVVTSVFIKQFTFGKITQRIGYSAVILYLATGIYFLNTTQAAEKGEGRVNQYRLINWISKNAYTFPVQPGRLYVLAQDTHEYVSTGDFLEYFNPHIKQQYAGPGSCPNPPEHETLYMVSKKTDCYKVYELDRRLINVGVFSDPLDEYAMYIQK